MGRAQCGQQSQGQLEVAEVVGHELRLVTARVQSPLGGGHDPGVVEQDLERTAGVQVAGGEGVDRGRVQQVEPADLDALDAGEGRCRAIRAARADGDRGAGLGQRTGDLQAEPDVAAGDDDVRARQVDAREDLISGRGRGESGSDGVLLVCHGPSLRPGARTLND